MANGIYDAAKEKLLQAGLDLSTLNLKLVLVDTASYTVDLANHDFLDDIPAGMRVATSGNLANPTFTKGVFNADDVVLSGVTGAESEALVIYNDTPGADSAKDLIAYIDTGVGNLPVTPNGGDININWANTGLDGAGGIFKL